MNVCMIPRLSVIPPALAGPVCLSPRGMPRFWATMWVSLKTPLADATLDKNLRGVDRLYSCAQALNDGEDCLDRMISNLEFDAIESVLTSFFSELRNESALNGADYSRNWQSALTFVKDIMQKAGTAVDARIEEIETRLRRLDRMYSQISTTPVRPPPPIRALPPIVVDELHTIFRPDSGRNPFKSEDNRWRNLLVFLMLLHLGLRRGEACALSRNAVKEELDLSTGKTTVWMNVRGVSDPDRRYGEGGLKTILSRRQIPVPQVVFHLLKRYIENYRSKTKHSRLLISKRRMPLSLRACNEIFETATRSLSDDALRSLEHQGLTSVSCHDLRHTCAVVRMRRYQDNGVKLDRAMEKLRLFFGWTPTSLMPLRYARAYFETTSAELWDENFDKFIDALRRTVGNGACA